MHHDLFIAEENKYYVYISGSMKWFSYIRDIKKFIFREDNKFAFFTSIEIVEDGQVCLRYTSQA